MSKETAELQAIESLAKSDLKEACAGARSLVAAHPDDEDAAALLRDVVQQFADADPRDAPQMPPVAPAVAEARELMAAGRIEDAEIILRQHLKAERHDPAAMHSMAEIAARCDLEEDADRILRESARIHAGSAEAWVDRSMTIYRMALTKDVPDLVSRAVVALDQALRLDPDYEMALSIQGSILAQTRATDRALATYERLLSLNPQVAVHWLNYGFLLKTLGRFGDGLAAYRTALALDPANGAAWWGLANLKIARFFPSDVEQMESALVSPDGTDLARVEISFALARAMDQAKQYERAAQLLEQGSKVRTAIQIPESDIITGDAGFVEHLFTRDFFEQRSGWGDPRGDAIFIVGMHRAGSTLVEQILSSHPDIEGTEELFILHQFSIELATRFRGKSAREIITALDATDVARLGERYLEIASRSRRTRRRFFTDKNPSNWRHIGLIHCMMPNARIIDVRRNPLDCCFANYAQHFQAGSNHTYDQQELGRYYADYVRTMRHFERVLPGRVHRLIYDDLVDDLESGVRLLLDYVGVPFEANCLHFYETERAVHTPSSEQVRQPINRSGFGKWRNYEPWLAELKDALGDALENWRA